MFGTFYPIYRLFVLVDRHLRLRPACGCCSDHTRLGALIRAGVDDAEMVEASGVNIRRVFLFTFLFGSALAGLGGLMGGAFLSLYPSADAEILVFSLAVVIIGGRGSLARRRVSVACWSGLLNTLRPGDVPRTRLFRDLRPDGGVARIPSARLVRDVPHDAAHIRTRHVLAGMTSRALVIALLVIVAACLPMVLSSYQVGLATEVLIFGVLAMSIDILAGFAGRTSLGHGAIFGVSTYVVVYCDRPAPGLSPWAALRMRVLAATAVAARYSRCSPVRTSGVYFLLLDAGARHDRVGRLLALDAGHRRRERHARRCAAGSA